MKITAISDLHGHLPTNINKCDVVCIAGDIFPLDIQMNLIRSISWFLVSFKPWVDSLPCDKVFLVAGNHDFLLEAMDYDFIINKATNRIHDPEDDKLVYLCDKEYQYKGKTFYGSPWCPELRNWAFYKNDKQLEEVFNRIPDKLDVLITHCPPKIENVGRVLDKDNWNYNKNFGCQQLADAISIRDINWVISGHIHSGEHDITKYQDKTNLVNVSIKDENYKVYYKPFVFEI